MKEPTEIVKDKRMLMLEAFENLRHFEEAIENFQNRDEDDMTKFKKILYLQNVLPCWEDNGEKTSDQLIKSEFWKKELKKLNDKEDDLDYLIKQKVYWESKWSELENNREYAEKIVDEIEKLVKSN